MFAATQSPQIRRLSTLAAALLIALGAVPGAAAGHTLHPRAAAGDHVVVSLSGVARGTPVDYLVGERVVARGRAGQATALPTAHYGRRAAWRTVRARVTPQRRVVAKARFAAVRSKRAAPTIVMTSAPAATTSATDATFAFTASASTSCSLDGAAYKSCWSPAKYTGLAPGTHRLVIRASNRYGTTSLAYSWTISVAAPPPTPPADTTAPTVAFSAPAAGAQVSGTVNGSACQATATDDTAVSSVAFSVDGQALNTDAAAPYGCAWDTTTVADGSHVLKAVARDAAGNTSTATVTVTVANAVADPTTPPATTPPSTSPSGESMPVGDLPGWKQVFTDDFTKDVPLGSFPGAVSDKWDAYNGFNDTSKNGTYSPGKVVSQKGGLMDLFLRTENGVHLVSAPAPKVNGSAWTGQLYGRYAARFRADSMPGYHTAWLLWPDSEVWPRDGEIDFPEGDLNDTICAFTHRQGGTSGSDQDAFCTNTTYQNWHTVVIEWAPNLVRYLIDGQVIGTSTSRVPNTPMHWVLQTETSYGGAPSSTVSGHVQIDWVSVWTRTA